ncbi:U32 family peptidase [Phytoactinopolyspora endophytica]|uniref:U32 family peptidase n=1 Tax=Phytoactinopolyspora endophytica TaxID=1642495 RepID=UPI00197C7F45|nr:U32 family peptidase [Phytoactinopolyspora endophytica]
MTPTRDQHATASAEPMQATRSFLASLGLPGRDLPELHSSGARFDDGRRFRVEIPSVERPDVFEAVLKAAEEFDIRIDRVSQGSGIMLLTDREIERMVTLGRDNGVEVSLFTGPRAAWDIGAQTGSTSGKVLGASLRGADQLVYGVEDVRRGCELGVRSVLVADVGQLWVLAEMKRAGELPADLVLKVSVSLPVANPATARVLQDIGASTLNLPVDLPVSAIAAIRSAVSIPVDVYIEGTDDFGSPVRHYELPEIVRVASPVYIKFAVRNAPSLHPYGGHLQRLAVETAQERVRRAAIGLGILRRYDAEAVQESARR